MNKRKKISNIRFLMISSQLLLSLFLGYWLLTQFSENKSLLTKELQRGLRQAEQQVIDSMLAKQLIDPILNDTTINSFYMLESAAVDSITVSSEFIYNHDSMNQFIMKIDDTHKNAVHLPGFSDNMSHINIIIDDSINHSDTSFLNNTVQDTSNKLLLKSIKLLISTVEQINPNNQNISTHFFTKIDTILLKSIYAEFLSNEYRGLSVSWISAKQADPDHSGFSELILKSDFFPNKYKTSIHHYRIYILKAISPQIIFALILLLITALAFRFAYVSLKNQQKLILLKNDFISNITHELKTPVSTVKVALEALLDFDMKKDQNRTKEYLEMAQGEMDRLDLLVNQVLNNAALEDERSFISMEQVNLVTIVNELLISMQTRFNRANASISFKMINEPVIITADKFHIHGVLVNLSDNSLKYCQEKPEIVIYIEQTTNETILFFEDNGIGIPVEYLDKVFDKFFRVPDGNKHNVKGFGLGLNYASLVMQQHHGYIKVKNLEKGGCQFKLVFPSNKS